MISLLQLLNEVVSTPKAIFLAGAAGSGKSYMTQQLIPSNLVVINSDDTYEEMLKASGIGLKQKDFTPDQLSQAAKLQAQARKVTQDKLAQAMSNAQNIVIDGTGAASNPILKKKQELETSTQVFEHKGHPSKQQDFLQDESDEPNPQRQGPPLENQNKYQHDQILPK